MIRKNTSTRGLEVKLIGNTTISQLTYSLIINPIVDYNNPEHLETLKSQIIHSIHNISDNKKNEEYLVIYVKVILIVDHVWEDKKTFWYTYDSQLDTLNKFKNTLETASNEILEITKENALEKQLPNQMLSSSNYVMHILIKNLKEINQATFKKNTNANSVANQQQQYHQLVSTLITEEKKNKDNKIDNKLCIHPEINIVYIGRDTGVDYLTKPEFQPIEWVNLNTSTFEMMVVKYSHEYYKRHPKSKKDQPTADPSVNATEDTKGSFTTAIPENSVIISNTENSPTNLNSPESSISQLSSNTSTVSEKEEEDVNKTYLELNS